MTGFQKDNPHGIENCSTVPNTVNEMLCQGHGGVLRIFPVWPENQDARFGNLRVDGAFLVSAEQKGGELLYVNVKSEKGRTCRLVNPWPGRVNSIQSSVDGERTMGGDPIVIDTRPGEEIILHGKKEDIAQDPNLQLFYRKPAKQWVEALPVTCILISPTR